MNNNLSWTSALGDAYVNQQDELMDAIQVLRQRAQAAGGLQSTSQQSVTTQGQPIAIEPADPEVVYVPEYDPWLVYGAPLAAYPGWVGVPGLYNDGPGIYFGVGLGVGLLAGVGWGWHHWGFDWHDRRAMFNHAPYISHSLAFANRGNFARAVPGIGHVAAFHGGIARGYAFRGRTSLGGGLPALHGGALHSDGFAGGGFHSGGFAGGGFHSGGFAGGGFHGGGVAAAAAGGTGNEKALENHATWVRLRHILAAGLTWFVRRRRALCREAGWRSRSFCSRQLQMVEPAASIGLASAGGL
jgi:hypothetical protein